MTANKLINNINNKIHEFGFDYVTYHSLMEDISDCVKEYDKEVDNLRRKANNKLIQENSRLQQENKKLLNKISRLESKSLWDNDYKW